MLRIIASAGLACLFLALLVFSVENASKIPRPGKPDIGNLHAHNNNNEADHKAEKTATLQINCDPNCAAQQSREAGNWIARFFIRIINDPLTLATLLLVIVVLVQVRDARNSSERQLRAYVVIKAVEFSRPNTEDGDEQHWPIHVVFRNAGQTPAYNVVVTAERVMGPNRPINEIFVLTDAAEVAPQSVMAPDGRQTMRLGGLEPGRTKFLAAQNAKFYCYVWGRLDYIDTFGRKHFTKFQLWHGFYTAILQFGFCQVGNGTDDKFPERWWRKVLCRRKGKGTAGHAES